MGKGNSEVAGSRFVKGRKQEALAAIEGWVGGSRDDIIKAGAAKVASHPPKNITEQKMLDSHLYDMSRQRFNFIVQCQWERKLFLEKQKRKTAVMRDLLRNVDLSSLAENPFVSRRIATVTTGSKRHSHPPEWEKSTTDDEEKKLEASIPPSTATDIFVTHKFPRSSEKKPEISSMSYPKGSSIRTQTTTSVQSRSFVQKKDKNRSYWPLNDIRYTRLSAVLCDNYPKVLHLYRQNEKI